MAVLDASRTPSLQTRIEDAVRKMTGEPVNGTGVDDDGKDKNLQGI